MANSPRLSLKNSIWIAIGAILLSVVVVALYYHITVLEPLGRSYQTTLMPDVQALNKRCKSLATTSDDFLLVKALVPAAEKQTQITTLQAKSKELRIELASFKSDLAKLPAYPLSFTSAAYAKSTSLKDQGLRTTDEISDTLNEYDGLLAFLMSYYQLRQVVNDSLAEFNTVSNLDLLSENTGTLYAEAAAIESKAVALSKLQTPRGFQDQQAMAIDLSKQIADGLRTQANSYVPFSDIAIYNAALNLEALTTKNEALNDTSLDTVIQKLPIIESISDLPETTDRFKF